MDSRKFKTISGSRRLEVKKGEDNLERFLDDIKKYKKYEMDREEEFVVMQQMLKGDMRAKERLITSCIPLSLYVVKMYQKIVDNDSPITTSDLIQEAILALSENAEKIDIFQTGKAIRFASFAIPVMRAAILNFLARNDSTIRLPAPYTTLMNKIRMGKELTEKEEDKLQRYMDALPDSFSYDKVTETHEDEEGEPSRFEDTFKYGQTIDRVYLHRTLMEELHIQLDSEDMFIIDAYYGLTDEKVKNVEIARIIETTPSNLPVIVERIRKKLSKSLVLKQLYRAIA